LTIKGTLFEKTRPLFSCTWVSVKDILQKVTCHTWPVRAVSAVSLIKVTSLVEVHLFWISASTGETCEKHHNPHCGSLAYKWCMCGTDRRTMNDTLLDQESTFSSVFWLLFKRLSRNIKITLYMPGL